MHERLCYCATIIYMTMGIFNLWRLDNAHCGISMFCFIAASVFSKLIFSIVDRVKTHGSGYKIILNIKSMDNADGYVLIAITKGQY